jgi:hypothetical protein
METFVAENMGNLIIVAGVLMFVVLFGVCKR